MKQKVLWHTLIVVMFIAIPSLVLAKSDFSVDGISYQYIDKTAKTVRVGWGTSNSYTWGNALSDNAKEKIIVPSTVTYGSTYTVVEIAPYAFAGSNITSIIIPESINTIGNGAFVNCSSLESIKIPNSVTKLGNSVFASCSNLTRVIIPESVNTIGDDAFKNCCSLESIKIPNSVTELGNSVFANCSNLINIQIPSSVITIKRNAFYGTKLEQVVIPNSVTSIEEGAFSGCNSLNSVVIGENVKYIYRAFCNCPNLRSVFSTTSPEKFHSSYNSSFYAIFNGCHSDAKLYVPYGMKYLYEAYSSWWNISNIVEASNDVVYAYVTLDDSLSIAEFMTLEDGKTDVQFGIGEFAAIPQSVRGIKIPSVVKGDLGKEYQVRKIGKHAFEECVSLEYISIPQSVKCIEDAFKNCSNLKRIQVESHSPQTITVKEGAFDSLYDNTILIVPAGSIENFKAISIWNKFSYIIETGPISSKSISAMVGTKVDLPICLRDSNEIKGIQFKLTLPKGITVNGTDGNLSANLTNRTEGMTVMGRKDPDTDNSYLFVLLSLSGVSISGSEGAVFKYCT